MNVDISQDFGNNENKFIIETPNSTKENDSNISLQTKTTNKDKEQEKDNLNRNNHSKKHLSILELNDMENKSNKKEIKILLMIRIIKLQEALIMIKRV